MTVWTEQNRYELWLKVAEMDFLNLPSCRRCGRVFYPMPGDREWLGYIANCGCDEAAHLAQFSDLQSHMDTLNKIATLDLRS